MESKDVIEDLDDKPGWKRPTKIPCFRTAFLYSVGGGLSTMLLTFLFTSNGYRASRYGLGVFAVSTLPLFVSCRYKRAQEMYKVQQFKKAMRGYEVKDI